LSLKANKNKFTMKYCYEAKNQSSFSFQDLKIDLSNWEKKTIYFYKENIFLNTCFFAKTFFLESLKISLLLLRIISLLLSVTFNYFWQNWHKKAILSYDFNYLQIRNYSQTRLLRTRL
jgi:hypothetical protein